MPKISVIVPVYKVEQYLCRCVDSVLAQTFDNFELILVDDGSPDNSGVMCDEYAAKDGRVKVIHKPNGGLSDARNTGLEYILAHSDSEWVTFIDSDDWIHHQYLQRLYQGVVDTDAGLSITEFVRTSGIDDLPAEGDLAIKVWYTEEYFVQHHLNANIACGKLYPKKAFENVRYPIGKIHEDEFTTYKILFNYDKVAVIAHPMYYYYVNPIGIMGSVGNDQNTDRLDALEERVGFFSQKAYPKAYQVSLESFVKVAGKKLNTPPTGEAYSSALIREMKEKLAFVEKHHVTALEGQARTEVQQLIDRERREFRSHALNRLLVNLLGKKRYIAFKQKLGRH